MSVTNVVGKQIIDLANDTNYYFEIAPQGDSQARYVDVTLVQNGSEYHIPSGSTAILEGKNAGGYNIFNPCTVSPTQDNLITIPLTNGVLSFAGIGKYSVGIYNGSNYILSFSFNIVVTEAPYDIIALQASDEYEALNQIIAKAADSNSWVVDYTAPPSPASADTHANDYYLDGSNGNVYYAYLDTDTGNMEWAPVINPTAAGGQLNIMEKTYIRYAKDTVGTGMSWTPVDPITGEILTCIGFYNSTNIRDDSDPSLDINIASNYTWASMISGIDQSNTWSKYLVVDEYTPTPPSDTEPWSTGWPSTIAPGGYMWIKTRVTFTDATFAEFYSVTKNGVSVDHMEKLKDDGDVSNGEKVFRFIYDNPGYEPTSISGTDANTNPHDLGWYERSGSAPNYVYTITSDTSVDISKTYYTKGRQSNPISVFNGTDAGFADNAVTASVQRTSGKSSVNVTESGGVADKAFDLEFNLRGSEIKSGTDITGSGVQTSTVFNETNALIGDLYINNTTGESYVCSAVTSTNSTWNPSFSFGPITFIDDLKNTKRYYGTLNPGMTSLTITGSDYMFSKADAEGTIYYYHVKYLTSLQGVFSNKNNPVTITDGNISVTLDFSNLNNEKLKVTPSGTEDPSAEGWYEKSGDTFSATSDTSVDPDKSYYTPVIICMEVIKKNR